MKRKTFITAVVLFLPFWIVAGALIVEVGLRMYIGHRADIGQSRTVTAADKYRAKDDALFQMVKEAHPPPDSVLWRAREREAFRALKEEERLDLAEERNELILTCDGAGVVDRIYRCKQCPELNVIGATVHPGDSLALILPPAALADALGLLRRADDDLHTMREYPIPMGNGRTHLVELDALRLSTEMPSFALFLADSRFEIFLRKYRPHVYQRNGYAVSFKESEFWTNALGFRNEEVAVPKPGGVYRIACIGGSTTVEGAHNDLTYPRMLQDRLREYFRTEAIEVVNCGVDGMAFPGELDRMADWLALEPDLVIHYNIINNASWLIQSATEKALQEEGPRGTLHRALTRSALLTALGMASHYPDLHYYTDELQDVALTCLKTIYQRAQDQGITMALASFAIPDEAELSQDECHYYESTFRLTPTLRGDLAELSRMINEYNRLVKAFCAAQNVLYIPVAENLSGGIKVFTDVCHLRLSGIERKATIMFEALQTFVDKALVQRGIIAP